ncbi:MAG: phosphoglycerate dehydrogenase, partial [Planctomycetales bacterium]|nr:phosphoglycerate dehydrogenase [Planctomycetales bacterium]
AICRSGVKLDAKALEGNQRLKAIVRAGVGTDNIDKTVATRQGIIVMNTPTGNTLSTAEHAFALMLAMSRNIAPAYQSLIEGRWDRGSYMGTQLADKTLGIVGLGRIGREVASRARAFKMRVIGYDPFMSDERATEMGIQLSPSVRDMLPSVDYLTVHTPLTPETENLIDMAELEIIKPGARLINCARGGIYNQDAMVAGLKSGRLAGIALDVYPDEPCTQNDLFGMPGVVCTPHLGASTEEAQTQVAIEGVQLLVNFLQHGEIRHAVNAAAVDPKTLHSLRGFLNVAHRLGRFLAQWHDGQPNKCRLFYRGDVATKDVKLLTAAFCAGLLERAMNEPVNIVNAEVLMHERGIEVSTECDPEQGAFRSSIRADLVTDKDSYTVAGTLFGNDMPRLVRLGEYRLEAYMDGVLLVFSHSDVPGIIGNVGTVFGKHQVNIAQMTVGRAGAAPGGNAIGVLNLDSAPSNVALDEVRNHPHIQSAEVIEMPRADDLPAWLQ